MILGVNDITFLFVFFFCFVLFLFVCFCFVFAAAERAVQCTRAACAAAGGLAVALYQLYFIYDDYNKCMNHCKKLESMLNLLKSDIYKREVDKEGVEEKMELLKIS